jgi:signal transduction histidine kinase
MANTPENKSQENAPQGEVKTAKSSLSARLLYLTIGFVMLAQVLIFVPSVSKYRQVWLEERLAAAHIASLAAQVSPEKKLGVVLTNELLKTAEIVAVRHVTDQKNSDSSKTHSPSEKINPILGMIPESEIRGFYDLRDPSFWQLLKDAFRTLAHTHPHNKMVSVIGTEAVGDDQNLQIVFNEETLCHDMWVYSWNTFLLSLLISFITASVIYYALNNLFVAPVRTITNSLIAFREKPEDQSTDLFTKRRDDEMGLVMSEMINMQDKIRQALNQKTHLAQLGEAVSKINHDLRNMLTSAQLVSDNLSEIDNPAVKKLAPRFVSAIDRAIRLCDHTLEYGSAKEDLFKFENFALAPVIDDVRTSLGLTKASNISLSHNIQDDLTLKGDADQIFRVFMNLTRNAMQAMKDGGKITIDLKQDGLKTFITLSDTAGGIPSKMKETLFKPFTGSASGGTGLGLAISKEIMLTHGGDISLITTGKEGSQFLMTFPASVI